MATMLDAFDVTQLPDDSSLILAYVDGYDTPDNAGNVGAVRARFPDAIVVTITTNGTNPAQFCDCELGDFDVAAAIKWTANEHVEGRYGGCYISLSDWSNYRHLFDPTTPFIVASWDGIPVIPDGAVGKQYESLDTYDVSITLDVPPFVRPLPAPQPSVEVSEVTAMILRNQDSNDEVFILGGKAIHIGSLGDSAAIAASFPTVSVSGALWAEIVGALGGEVAPPQ